MTGQEPVYLIGIPYAGGGKYSFNEFKPHLSKRGIELLTLELPGRGKRVMEPLLTDLSAMVDDLFMQLQPYLDKNYILYGHSMGGTLGNYLIHRVKDEGLSLPLLFMATGCAAPKYKKYDTLMHKLGHIALKEELRKLGGFPEEVLASDELMEFILPIMRADLTALENWKDNRSDCYEVPLYILSGTNEKIDDQQVEGWREETTGDFNSLKLEGNHFFILKHYPTLAKILDENIKSFLKRKRVSYS